MLKKLFNLLSIFLTIFIFNCSTNQVYDGKKTGFYTSFDTLVYHSPIIENHYYQWYNKDLDKDSIPGISLEKLNKLISKKKPIDTIVVAILDSPVDIDHPDLENSIWTNIDEIPNNGIDDDLNGYIDDLNGWNFLGLANGSQQVYVNYEYTRILKRYENNLQDISTSTYQRAFDKYKEQSQYAKGEIEYADMLFNLSENADKTLAPFFPNKNYSIAKLDSISAAHPMDTVIRNDALRIKNFIKYNITQDYILSNKTLAHARLEKLLNKEFNDRPDDLNSSDIQTSIYGNHKLNKELQLLNHGTRIAGILTANQKDSSAINGVSDVIKIMPICVSGLGDEHDKDIALGIRYAVDNGARVINMSFGKEFSLYKDMVNKAIEYALENNVLIVSSAGNETKNLSNSLNYYYPNGHLINKEAENFILVGASGDNSDGNLVAPFSNYGQNDVDIFAPGQKINTIWPNKSKSTDNGSSLSAAMTSGVAALILSYYPQLKVTELKNILIKSGTRFNQKVYLIKDRDTLTIPFKDISKSGAILNAYQAFKLASYYIEQ